tara:strand:+ start:77 stop:442 length:366 start_codon:yes stop_codon:yes gene_type:complete
MAHFTVIYPDKAIYEDGICMARCDMSGLPDDMNALQWNGSDGHIEYTDVLKPNLIISSESEIESALGVSLSELKTRYNNRKTVRKEEVNNISTHYNIENYPDAPDTLAPIFEPDVFHDEEH